MNNIIDSLNSIFKITSTWQNKGIDDVKLREGNIKLVDAVLYRFQYSRINNTKQQIVSSINFDTNKTIDRTCFDRKENNISIDLYTNILNSVRNFFNKNCNYNNILIISVDGTFNNTNINKLDNTLETSLNMGFYDVSNDIPFDLQFTGPGKKILKLLN
jgi:hypothetical protein